jgi:protein arginine kinase activator
MICDNCKRNEAIVHFISFGSGGELQKINLCRECLKDLSFLSDVSDNEQNENYPLNILAINMGQASGSGFFDDEYNRSGLGLSVSENRKCSNCSISIKQVKKTGRLGCPRCYEDFSEELNPFIKIIQSGTEHKGRIPINSNKKLKIEKKIKDLKFMLEEQIIIENFEEAAKLRDKITSLQKQLYFSVKRNKK